MSLVYTFATSPDAAGLDVTVKDARTGETAASGEFSGSANLDGDVTFSTALDEGVYIAEVEVPGVDGLDTESHPSWLRTIQGVLDIPASLAAGGGGASETDGVGAVFFGGNSLAVPFDNTAVYCDFVASDDPPRAPQRDDLMVIDEEDDTTINIVRSGLYDITLNVPCLLQDVAVDESASVDLQLSIDVEVNGGNEPPAYDYNNRVFWRVNDPVDTGDLAGQTMNLHQSQVLLAGDTLQLRFKIAQAGLGNVTAGALHLHPDITFVLTYRGPVTL